MSSLSRETPSCSHCGSNVRFRSVIDVLLSRYFGSGKVLTSVPERKDIVGLGLSDWEGYASHLSEKFSYRNSHYHIEPRLDICDPPKSLLGTNDFLISSDVFEHVLPPVSRAMEGAHALLKKGGLLVLTVPFRPDGPTIEHYPDAKSVSVSKGGRVRILRGDGTTYEPKDPVFHGGPGSTLEMRVFGLEDLRACLRNAGFEEIVVHGDPVFDVGILHKDEWSLPVSAVKV